MKIFNYPMKIKEWSNLQYILYEWMYENEEELQDCESNKTRRKKKIY